MARAFTPGLQATSHTIVTKVRELPIVGEVVVSVGDRVESGVPIARGELPGELYILRLPERMGLEVFEVLAGLKKKEGSKVVRGEVLCEHAGMFGLLKTRFEVPEDGIIEFVAEKSAHVGLRLPSKPIAVDSYMGGTVINISEGRSATLQTDAALVQGIFGVGGERQGTLRLLDLDPSREVLPENLPSDLSGAIIVGGSRPSLEALTVAADRGAAGCICGSVDDQVLAEYLGYDLGIALTGDEEVPLTLILTEGFGNMPISERVLAILREHEGQLAAVNGATQVRAGAVRPEIIVPLTTQNQTKTQEGVSDGGGLGIGRAIWIIRVPYFGKRATVVELPTEEQQIETGAFTRVLKAKLDGSEEVVIVPRANVELV